MTMTVLHHLSPLLLLLCLGPASALVALPRPGRALGRALLRPAPSSGRGPRLPPPRDGGGDGLRVGYTAAGPLLAAAARADGEPPRRSRNPIRWLRGMPSRAASRLLGRRPEGGGPRGAADAERGGTAIARRGGFPLVALLAACRLLRPCPALAASGGMARPPGGSAPLSTNEFASKLTIWLGIFVGLALLHAAEIAITTLYPWKVREFAEEEEKADAAAGGPRRRRGTFTALE